MFVLGKSSYLLKQISEHFKRKKNNDYLTLTPYVVKTVKSFNNKH